MKSYQICSKVPLRVKLIMQINKNMRPKSCPFSQKLAAKIDIKTVFHKLRMSDLYRDTPERFTFWCLFVCNRQSNVMYEVYTAFLCLISVNDNDVVKSKIYLLSIFSQRVLSKGSYFYQLAGRRLKWVSQQVLGELKFQSISISNIRNYYLTFNTFWLYKFQS